MNTFKKMKTLQKFTNDFWSVLSIIYVFFCIIVALFAYILSSDTSKNANTMHLSIHSKPPLFSVKILSMPYKKDENEGIKRYFFGTEQLKTEIPIETYKVTSKGIFYKEYKGFSKFLSKDDFSEIISVEKFASKNIRTQIFWLGTDKYGRDMLSRMFIGARVSLLVGGITVVISLLIGVFMGVLSGYFQGKIDAFILWIINVVWSIPTLLLVIAFTLVLGKGYWQVFVAVGFTMWVEVARVVRGQVMSLRKMQYIEAARVLGFSNFRIIKNHILPNVVPSLIVISASNFATAILIESGLSFLGIGAQPPTPTWGGMVKDHYNYILLGKPFLAIIPGMALMLLVLSFMYLGNRLRDFLDVKS